ncbi:MAG: hypothetical protein R3B97_09445 [Dehalococcoidia bacterium]|nr:hypothetical protein [Dehalococcoidia bacterium]MCB9484753.1 hypothetical protein [Thermoflexaceae bacterium]
MRLAPSALATVAVAALLSGCGAKDDQAGAYERLLGQLNSNDFAAAYEWLHPEQQLWVSPERFRACYATLSRFSPAAKLVRVVRAERAMVEIPGPADVSEMATRLEVTVEFDSGSVALKLLTVHMVGGDRERTAVVPRWLMDEATVEAARNGICNTGSMAETIA